MCAWAGAEEPHGDIQRHGAFIMHDRTIPLGSNRGETHSANRGVLLERFIE
jgi:hypothetical protein